MIPSEHARQLRLARNDARAAIGHAARLALTQGHRKSFSQAVCLFISALEARTARNLVGLEEQAIDLVCALREDRPRPRPLEEESLFRPPVAEEPGPPQDKPGSEEAAPV